MKASHVILYSQRVALGKAFEKWAEKNYAVKNWENFITFLMQNGMINHDAVIEYLEEMSKK